MSDNYRKQRKESWGEGLQVDVPIHGNVKVEKGDLLFLDRADGLRNKGASTADRYGYPFEKMSGATRTLASNRLLAAEHFLGVAAWHSDAGVTENLAVHITGLFRYPLKLGSITL